MPTSRLAARVIYKRIGKKINEWTEPQKCEPAEKCERAEKLSPIQSESLVPIPYLEGVGAKKKKDNERPEKEKADSQKKALQRKQIKKGRLKKLSLKYPK